MKNCLKENIKKLIIFTLLLFTFGCAGKTIYQIQGIPVPDKVIQAKILQLNIIIRYDLTQHFVVQEGDESYRSHEYLSLIKEGFHSISEGQHVEMKLNIFNPTYRYYKINQYTINENGVSYKTEVYKGDLSRNSFEFRLSHFINENVITYFDVRDKNDNLVYESFRTQYHIEG